MSDSLPKTSEQIRYNMSCIHSKDTKIEVELRTELWSRGLRYRKNVKDIPDKPDIAFIEKKIAIFYDSKFWQRWTESIAKTISRPIWSC